MIYMAKNSFSRKVPRWPARQRGMVATVIAVIVLLATLLASLALMTSTDTSNLIAGNLSFKQAIVQEAERAYAQAQATIPFSGPASESDNASIGFYSSIHYGTVAGMQDIPDVINPASAGFSTGGLVTMPTLSTGNVVYYMVERLCPNTGTASPPGPVAGANPCIIPGATYSAGTHGMENDSGANLPAGVLPAYRLTVRVNGPKNTGGFVQTILR